MTLVVEIDPNRPCDRCRHPSKLHRRSTEERIGSECMVASGPKVRGARAKLCWCDGYVPA
jgi:hypothetical protein